MGRGLEAVKQVPENAKEIRKNLKIKRPRNIQKDSPKDLGSCYCITTVTRGRTQLVIKKNKTKIGNII